jgi:hypothetical protein
MTRQALPALVLGPLLLAACTQAPTAGPPAAAPPGFQCAPAGTVVTASDGRVIRHLGTDRNDPELCLAAVEAASRGGATPLLFGLITPQSVSAPEARAALRGLYPLAPGHTARWQARDLSNNVWTVEVSVVGRETITVPAGRFETWKLAIEDKGFGFNSFFARADRWVTDQGIVVKQAGEVVRGVAQRGSFWSENWEAVTVTRP